MRRLDTAMKINLIKQNELPTPGAAEAPPGTPRAVSRPGTAKRTQTDDAAAPVATTEEPRETKKSRPRSLTFTLTGKHKGDADGNSSPSKRRNRSRGPSAHKRKKSQDQVPMSRSASATSVASTASGLAPPPEDFIAYLRATRRPQRVEVGRLQKLKQILRNETVAWVDDFVAGGGMHEVVGLLYRIVEIEWR